MLEHRMAGEADLAVDLDRLGLGLDAVEFDRRRGDEIHALQTAEEIEMPPGPAELAVGDELEPDLLLLGDDVLDLAVLDRLERGGVDLALGVPLARLLAAPGAAGCRHDRRETGAVVRWHHLLSLRSCPRPVTTRFASYAGLGVPPRRGIRDGGKRGPSSF